MAIPFHPLAEIFPLLDGDRFAALVESVRKNGLIDPITLHDGKIIDGRNRYRACLAADVEPRFVPLEWEGLLADFVWARGERREQTSGERVISAGRYAVAREGEAKERQGARTDITSVHTCTEVEFGRSREIAAEKFGVSERTVSNSVKVLKEGAPELVAAVERGEVSVRAAADVATLPKPKQAEIVALGKSDILQAVREIRAEHAERRCAEKPRTPLIDLKGRDPKEFNRAMHYIGPINHYAEDLSDMDHDAILPILTEKERAEVMVAISKINAIHAMIAGRI